jgi:hypothetical protein
MMRIVRPIGAASLLLACAFHPGVGHACTATTPDVFSVGNTATDASCNYGSIQAAITAATCPAGTKIILNKSGLNPNGDYTNQHLLIQNKNITLVGRANTPKCNSLQAVCGVNFPCPIAPLRTIEGNIKVRGTSNVVIQYLTITKGNGVADSHGTTYGGGIDYAATGDLDIETSTIEDNTANNGGGIRFQGYGGHADLYLHSHTQIDNNQATNGGSGGGIRIEGDATLHADEPNITIHDNVAADKGGGIAIVGPAYAHVGSIGDFFFGRVGVLYTNHANYGGGIAVIAQSTGSAGVDLFATDPANPVLIEDNTAYQGAGGGIYLVPYIYTQAGGAIPINVAVLHMEGAHIDGNAAKEGAGIYADVNSTFAFVDYAYAGGEVDMYSGGSCAAGQECNTVSDNRAVTLDSSLNEVPTAGSAILIQTNGVFNAQQLAMRGNQGAHAIRVADSLHENLHLYTCLLADNQASAELVTFGSASASVNQCTIAGNEIGGASVAYAETGFSMTNSIVEQGSLPAVHYVGSGAGLTLDYLLLSPTAPYIGATNSIVADDGFVDAANGDYHLLHTSRAVDVAPAGDAADRDLDKRPRDQDLPGVANRAGPRDLGAYELQLGVCDASDTIFCNGFEQN